MLMCEINCLKWDMLTILHPGLTVRFLWVLYLENIESCASKTGTKTSILLYIAAFHVLRAIDGKKKIQLQLKYMPWNSEVARWHFRKTSLRIILGCNSRTHTEKNFSKSFKIKPKSDCIDHLQIDLEPNWRPFGSNNKISKRFFWMWCSVFGHARLKKIFYFSCSRN